MDMHTHKHIKSNMIPEIPSVFSIGFLQEKKKKRILSQRILMADFVAQNIPG